MTRCSRRSGWRGRWCTRRWVFGCVGARVRARRVGGRWGVGVGASGGAAASLAWPARPAHAAGARGCCCAAQMLLRHPLPFSHNAHMGHVPTVAVQTSRNLEEYRPMWDPTAGACKGGVGGGPEHLCRGRGALQGRPLLRQAWVRRAPCRTISTPAPHAHATAPCCLPRLAGCRSSRFTPTQQAISPRPFAHHPAKTGYIDLGLVGDVSALPPNSYRPPPPPQHRAGYSSLELRKKHEPKPPKVLAS